MEWLEETVRGLMQRLHELAAQLPQQALSQADESEGQEVDEVNDDDSNASDAEIEQKELLEFLSTTAYCLPMRFQRICAASWWRAWPR